MTARYFERFLDPWREFERINNLLNWTDTNGTCEYPAVNVWVNKGNAILTTEIPGIKQDKLDVSVSGNTVTIAGTRPADEKKDVESYHRHELRHGDFRKTVRLPFNIDSGKVDASYKRGVLYLTLPQLEADKPKKIDIKTG